MKHKFVINGTLPNLNNYLAAERQTFRHKGRFTTKGNILKQDTQERVIFDLRRQLGRTHINHPIYIKYTFYEPNRKRDKDNVASFAMKIIQDSLVKAGVIKNDGWKNIVGFSCDFGIDKDNPRIEVTLVEMDGDV